MPRIRPLGGSSGALGGFRAPGLYAALLDGEREACLKWDPRWTRSEAGRRGEEPPTFYRRSRYLLEALEAGKTVVVPLPPKWGLPWKRPEVRTVTVTPDDLVRPTDLPCAYPGSAVDDAEALGA